MDTLKRDAHLIMEAAIQAVMPGTAVENALRGMLTDHGITVISIGKAAWTMANAACAVLGDQIRQGLIVTKYQHAQGPIPNFEIIEAGHPVPDENSVRGAERALQMVADLEAHRDFILLLVSGGGSALFEQPLDGLSLGDIQGITDKLLAGGANITEMNTVRKHLSQVKGGRFAEACGEVELRLIVLSDVIGDPLEVIASGPAFPDASTSEQAFDILKRYDIPINPACRRAIERETPKSLKPIQSIMAGNVEKLCEAAARQCEALGYTPVILSTRIENEASEFGAALAAMASEVVRNSGSQYSIKPPCALIFGGETVVHLKGKGKGGRNQELALSAAFGIEGLDKMLIFSVGSDGTDGPTDAAGGMVDGKTLERIRLAGFDPRALLDDNDAYRALSLSGDLIMTGPTGTNVNDLMVALIGK